MGRCRAGRAAKNPRSARRVDADGSRFAAGATGYVHQHPHEQISYCTSGRFEYSLNGKIVVLSEGQSIYVPSNAPHGAKALESGTLIDVFTPLREDLLKRR